MVQYLYVTFYAYSYTSRLRRGLRHNAAKSMASVLSRRHVPESSKAVKYTPCAKGEQTDEEELEEIAVVSRDDVGYQRDEDGGDPGGSVTANGPRVLPGPGVYQTPYSDRTKLIGERLSSSGKINLSSPVYSGKVIEQKSKSTSKQSLMEIVSNKLDKVTGRKSQTYSKEELAFLNKAHLHTAMTPKEIRKQRRKEIDEKFGKKARKQAQMDAFETSTAASSDKDGCRWTFVFDPAGRLAYWWSFVVSIAFLYNFWVMIYRFAMDEIHSKTVKVWFPCDYTADLLYMLDIAFHFRTGYLEDGVLQTDATKLRIHYMNTTTFYVDLLCLLPLDFLYLSLGYKSILRVFRLVKIYRFWAFLDRTERHTNFPNVVRTVSLLHYLFAIFHWNACLCFLVITQLPTRNTTWAYPTDVELQEGVFDRYLHSLYLSTLAMTQVGDLPRPADTGEYIFVIMENVFGLLLFASVLGHIGNIVTSVSAARKEFQGRRTFSRIHLISSPFLQLKMYFVVFLDLYSEFQGGLPFLGILL